MILGYSKGDLFTNTPAGEAERLYRRLALAHYRSIGGDHERTNRLGKLRSKAWWRFARRIKNGEMHA